MYFLAFSHWEIGVVGGALLFFWGWRIHWRVATCNALWQARASLQKKERAKGFQSFKRAGGAAADAGGKK